MIFLYGPVQFLKFLLRELEYRVISQVAHGSFSQGDEDLIIDKYFNFKDKGFYVDIGANDPVRFNNTYRFYKKGWCGINVEPEEKNFRKLKRLRPADINLCFGVGTQKIKTFYQFLPSTLSTFSSKEAKRYKDLGFKMLGQRKIALKKLSSIIGQYTKGKEIDYMSIDTEGSDLDVLMSNNWSRLRPKLICIEVGERELKRAKWKKTNEKVSKYLKALGYKELYNNKVNAIFVLSY